VWLKGHTGAQYLRLLNNISEPSPVYADFMTLTLLFSQPVSALQILTKDEQWKWVRHVENGVVRHTHPRAFELTLILMQLVNIGEAVEFLTGGYYKPTIHRYGLHRKLHINLIRN
jgi:isopenicillin N synthase-like dioxygenase